MHGEFFSISREISTGIYPVVEMCGRLLEERRRLGVSQTEMGKMGGVALNTYHSYEKGTRVPDAECLANLYQAGVDVLYIVTGVRNNSNLSNAEMVLLEGFKRLDERGKAVVQAVVQTYNTLS